MLDRDTILRALNALSEELGRRDVRGEVCLFGGAVMVLAFRTRHSTNDVDAIFAPTTAIREAALKVGEELHLPSGWLNDGVKGFVSEQHAVTQGDLPQFPYLTVAMPLPEYLLAMKCLAARAEAESRDFEDVKFLLHHLAITGAEAALKIVEKYYPAHQVPPRTQYFVEAAINDVPKS